MELLWTFAPLQLVGLAWEPPLKIQLLPPSFHHKDERDSTDHDAGRLVPDVWWLRTFTHTALQEAQVRTTIRSRLKVFPRFILIICDSPDRTTLRCASSPSLR